MCVCVCVCVYIYRCVYIHMETECYSSEAVYLVCGDRISSWVLGSLVKSGCLATSPERENLTLGFHMPSADLNPEPHACTASTLLRKLSPYFVFSFLKYFSYLLKRLFLLFLIIFVSLKQANGQWFLIFPILSHNALWPTSMSCVGPWPRTSLCRGGNAACSLG